MAVYTLFGQAPTGSDPAVVDSTSYNFGVQFSVSQPAALTAIWFYSPSGAGSLPFTIVLYQVSGTSVVTSQGSGASPVTWSGAAGSGWVRAAFTSPPALTAGTAYKAGVVGGGTNWYSASTGYWTTGGPGAAGITSGPLSAPNETGASPGQDSFVQSSVPTYPGTDGTAQNWWVDPEVTVTGGGRAATPGKTWLRRFHHRQLPPQFPAAATAPTAIGLTDAGAADDTSLLAVSAAVALTDSGISAETPAAAASVPLTDSGTGTDALAVAIPVALTDAGTGTDSLSVAIAAAVALTDAGTGTDSLSATVATAVPLTDAGTGTDALTVSAALPLADTGSAAQALAVSSAVALADSGAGQDILAIGATVPLTGAGTGTDLLGAGIPTPVTDSGTGTDTLAVTAATAISLPDAGTGTAAFGTVLATTSLAELSAAADALSVSALAVAFTVGSLTAADVPGAVLTAAGASSALTAAVDAALAVLTTTDSPTGPAEFFPVQLENLTELTDEAGGQLA